MKCRSDFIGASEGMRTIGKDRASLVVYPYGIHTGSWVVLIRT